jgi:DNA-binding CsgD family transcriptional regulator
VSTLSTLLLELHRGSQRISPEDFQEWAFQTVKQVLPFDSGLWASAALSESGLIIHSCFLHNQPPELMSDYAQIWRSDPLFKGISASVGTTMNVHPPFRQLPELKDYVKKFDLHHAIATMVRDATTNLLSVICWYRSVGKERFSEEERRMKEDLMPHLVETWANNRLAHALRTSDRWHRPAYAAAVVDSTGVLHVTDQMFPQLMSEEWARWHGPSIPPELAQHVFRSTAHAFTGKSIIVRSSRLGDQWLLHSRRRDRYDTLTNREHDIARLVADGASQKQIARSLGISPSTVNNHLTRIYRKLEIEDKTQLTRLLTQFD